MGPRTASVSTCGFISYRDSLAHDAGFQPDTVVPGCGREFDVADLIEVSEQCDHL